MPGLPAAIRSFNFPHESSLAILIGKYRKELEVMARTSASLAELPSELEAEPGSERRARIGAAELQSLAEWATELLDAIGESDPVTNILNVNEDVLGVYRIMPTPGRSRDHIANQARIELYWGVIGIVAQWLASTVEDLTIVVLTHELARAYTQLGTDIEGRRWHTDAFASAEVGLKEGLAQYNTQRALWRMEGRYPGAYAVYEALLERQPPAYRTHLPWLGESSPEGVRRAMLEMRRWKEPSLAQFNERLATAEVALSPE